MTADEASYTGERHRQEAKNTEDSDLGINGREIRVLAPVPDLDWRADLFASAIIDDYELDDKLAGNDQSLITMNHLPDNHNDHDNQETAIWLHQPVHPGTLAGVAP